MARRIQAISNGSTESYPDKEKPPEGGFAVSIPDAYVSGSPTRLRDAEPGRTLQLFCMACVSCEGAKCKEKPPEGGFAVSIPDAYL